MTTTARRPSTTGPLLGPAEEALLHDLVSLDTVSPLESDSLGDLPQALAVVEDYAARHDFEVVERLTPHPGLVDDLVLPVAVEEAAACHGPDFWRLQPSLVLCRGSSEDTGRTVMLNAHVDTVGPHEPPVWNGRVLTGRGATDAKGGLVAVLAAVARLTEEDLARGRALVQVVAGEEGGAMGTYGTRALLQQGHRGALNLFVEPTGGRVVTSSRASMTLAVEIDGTDASDDTPEAGHNATVVLAAVADHLARESAALAGKAGTGLCIAGLHTGTAHNRVYGQGRLLVNASYDRNDLGTWLADRLEQAVYAGLANLRREHAENPLFARTVADLVEITRVRWLKRGLPALEPPAADHPLLPLLARHLGPVETGSDALVCDAIWAGQDDGLTVVCGPGSIADNRCHASGEFSDLNDLEDYTRRLTDLLTAFLSSRTGRSST